MLQDPKDLAPYIDHTLLKAESTRHDIDRLCAEAAQYGFKAVCVNSSFVAQAAQRLQGTQVHVASVVGFPLGACLRGIKAAEARAAVDLGASEIDMVIALGAVKAGDWLDVEKDVSDVVRAAQPALVKVILETGLLQPEEIRRACEVAVQAGAHFVKTSTGFLGRGATLEDIRLMREAVKGRAKIKASGGIKTFAAACEMVAAGAERIGTSSGVALVSGGAATTSY